MNTLYKNDLQKTAVPKGLTTAEAAASIAKHGANVILRRRKKSFFRRYLEGFSDPIIRILLFALLLNVIISIGNVDLYETAGIVIAVMISTVVSAVSEHGSERAFEKLNEKSTSVFCRVMRDGVAVMLPCSQVAVGDAVLLSAGDGIPADGTVVSGRVSVDQSALNGESRDEEKMPLAGGFPSGADLPERKNVLLRGSTVTSGSCVMQVERVGESTMYGGIAASLLSEKRESPLKHRLSELARAVSSLGYAAAAMVAVAFLFNEYFIGNGMYMPRVIAALSDVRGLVANLLAAATLAISVLVVAVPEGLPMMITVVLSSNMNRMLRDKVLVRKLVGIETAGSLNVLFCDKTGTLTCGDFTVTKYVTAEEEFSAVSTMRRRQRIHGLYLASCIYNTDSSVGMKNGRREPLGGNSTDRALLESVIDESTACLRGVRLLERTPFNSENKYSEATVDTPEGKLTLVKGAPEIILSRADTYVSANGEIKPLLSRGALTEKYRAAAREGKRMIAVAVAKGEHRGLPPTLSFLLLVFINDEARPEARAAVSEIRGAGVSVVMITGDGEDTARAIGERVGILDKGGGTVLTGAALRTLTEGELTALLPSLRVVCRALPGDKERLVRVSQKAGLVVGMTGDGVNDAPALKASDVGFALGSGTEVAKEAGDIVILDDNVKSIGRAILYGRTIFDSIRKFIVFQLTMNLCAVGVSVLGPFIGVESPVTVIQMLWVNLIMDTLGGLAFAGEAPRRDYMRELPKRRDEKILGKKEISRVLITGGFAVAASLCYLKLPFFRDTFGYGGDYGRFITVFFAMFVFCGIFMAFNCRTTRINLASHIGKNPAFLFIMAATAAVQLLIVYFGGRIFRTTPLSARDMCFALAAAFTVVPFDLLRKCLIRKKRK